MSILFADTAGQGTARPGWRSLPRGAMGFRILHIAWGLMALAALAHVWSGALLGRRDRYLWFSVALLLIQGVALVIGRGNCPLGPMQRRLGDPVPMFDLVLRPRAAKAAMPLLFIVAVAGITAVLVRQGMPALSPRTRSAAHRVAARSGRCDRRREPSRGVVRRP